MTKSVLFFKVINCCFSERIKVSHCKELMSLEKKDTEGRIISSCQTGLSQGGPEFAHGSLILGESSNPDALFSSLFEKVLIIPLQ